MSFKQFKSIFENILCETPLPYEDRWKLQHLGNADLQSDQGWMEVLYRTYAYYQCKRGHCWKSSWGMILFRFHLDVHKGNGRVRMKRFGQCCNVCKDDDTYYIGFCGINEVWFTVQRLLLYILQRCYEMRAESDVDAEAYIIPVSDVAPGRFGGTSHQKGFCEACAYDRCQEKYRQLTKKK